MQLVDILLNCFGVNHVFGDCTIYLGIFTLVSNLHEYTMDNHLDHLLRIEAFL